MINLIRRLAFALPLILVGLWVVSYFLLASPEHRYTPVTDAQKQMAREYLAPILPDMPAGWQWSELEVEPGIKLRTGKISAENPKGTIVIASGYSAPIETSSTAIIRFHQAGYSVAALDRRGQGKSWRPLPNPEKGYVKDYAEYSADLHAFLKQQQGPVFVYAISQGAHVALRMAGEHAPDVKAYALVVPMVKIKTEPWPYRVAGAISSFYALTGQGDYYSIGRRDWDINNITFGSPTTCNPNPKTAQMRDALVALDPQLRISGTTNQWVHASMASTLKITSPVFRAKINKPVLMFNAGDKETYVNPDAARQMCNGLRNCRSVDYPKASHCITIEDPAVGDDIRDRTLAFFATHN